MIVCPECGAQNPDETAFCGNCGTKLDTDAGKKTMFGIGAVGEDQLKKAAEEARKARQAAEARQQTQADEAGDAEEAPAQAASKPSGVKLPPLPRPPSGPRSDAPPAGASSGLPRPQDDEPGATPEQAPSVPEGVDRELGEVSSDAKTLAMEPVSRPEPAGPDPEAPDLASDEPLDEWAFSDDAQDGPSSFGGDLGDPLADDPSDRYDTIPEEPEFGGPQSDFGLGPDALPQAAPGGPLQNASAGDPLDPGPTAGAQKSKTLIYVAIGIAAAMMMCCIVSALAYWLIGI